MSRRLEDVLQERVRERRPPPSSRSWIRRIWAELPSIRSVFRRAAR